MMKTMKEKLDEIIPLLKKLKEIGIIPNDPGYTMTKALMDVWLKSEIDIHEEIQFVRYGRVGVLDLYSKRGKRPSFVLKATEELKEYVDRQEAEEAKEEDETSAETSAEASVISSAKAESEASVTSTSSAKAESEAEEDKA
jgi:CRISPR/Cas system-associated endonuclease Cas1